MTAKKNWIKLIGLFISSNLIALVLIGFRVIDIDKIRGLNEGFQYNVISTSAVIGGFLFTGISILVSLIDKDRIKRLWENKYLDNLYRYSYIGILSNLLTIVCAFIVLSINMRKEVERIVIRVEVTCFIVGIIFFAVCLLRLKSLIIKLKNE